MALRAVPIPPINSIFTFLPFHIGLSSPILCPYPQLAAIGYDMDTPAAPSLITNDTHWVTTFLMQKPTETEMELVLHQLLANYYTKCEEYDRTVCTGPIIDGAILPTTPLERARVSQNAHTLWREFMAQADAIGATPGQIREAKRAAILARKFR